MWTSTFRQWHLWKFCRHYVNRKGNHKKKKRESERKRKMNKRTSQMVKKHNNTYLKTLIIFWRKHGEENDNKRAKKTKKKKKRTLGQAEVADTSTSLSFSNSSFGNACLLGPKKILIPLKMFYCAIKRAHFHAGSSVNAGTPFSNADLPFFFILIIYFFFIKWVWPFPFAVLPFRN